MESQLTIVSAPATRRPIATSDSARSCTGAEISAGPKAPQAKDTTIAEQDQTAWAVAKPARGIAMKLKSAAKTKSTPPRAPARVKSAGVPAITGTNKEDRNTPTQTKPLKMTGSSGGPLGIRANAGKAPLKNEDRTAKASAVPAGPEAPATSTPTAGRLVFGCPKLTLAKGTRCSGCSNRARGQGGAETPVCGARMNVAFRASNITATSAIQSHRLLHTFEGLMRWKQHSLLCNCGSCACEAMCWWHLI
mmetsp:Transcript_55189/g.109667  ORF Transcript_55189/g.109667 Transcript_55189/m.109667 type:complete len:249 (-) Transcript_55189:33-779(-)